MSGTFAAVLLTLCAPSWARHAAFEPVRIEALTATHYGPALGAAPLLPAASLALPVPTISVPSVPVRPVQEQKAPEVNWDGLGAFKKLAEPPKAQASAAGGHEGLAPSVPQPAEKPAAPPPQPPRAPKTSALASAVRVLAPLVGTVALLALLDIAVLEAYLHPLHEKLGLPWSEFEMNVFGTPFLKWWGYFLPAGAGLLSIVGWLSGRWRGILAGLLLFATGLEDVLYYALLRSPLPDSLPWLDYNPLIKWTTLLTGTDSVAGAGLALASATGFGLAAWLAAKGKKTS